MTKAMFPTDCCSSDVSIEEKVWFEEVCRDPAYAHTVQNSAEIYLEVVRNQTLGPAAIVHINRAIILLRKELADANLVITDTTIIVTVLLLSMVSSVSEISKAARKHLHGLYKLVTLRWRHISHCGKQSTANKVSQVCHQAPSTAHRHLSLTTGTVMKD